MTVAAILLAAGRSTRFGPQNKLLAAFRGEPLVVHAAISLRQLKVDHRIAVTSDPGVSDLLADFCLVNADTSDCSMSKSLKLGLSAAMRLNADKVLIVLGDMPFVEPELLSAVVDRCGTESPSAAADDNKISPPTCFPASWYSRLLALEGDRGAGRLVSSLSPEQLVHVDAKALVDLDFVRDFRLLAR